jgi:hypothetical protein
MTDAMMSLKIEKTPDADLLRRPERHEQGTPKPLEPAQEKAEVVAGSGLRPLAPRSTPQA